MTFPIQMVDVRAQYNRIRDEVDQAIQGVIESCAFINGPEVKLFAENLAAYLNVKTVIPCANGTDALMIAFMALDLEPGDEVIVPAFTYVATAEVIALLRLKPVMIDVDYETFNVAVDQIEECTNDKTRAIVPVHLFGQNANMEAILEIAERKDLKVVEDAAQSIGAKGYLSDGSFAFSGCMGDIGTTSFYPSKNLGCYGDGGALFTNHPNLGERIAKISNHGQSEKYYHEMIGVNSRLDSIQAAILNQKLKYLDEYNSARHKAADFYDEGFRDIEEIAIPVRSSGSTHVFHQYTLKITNGKRDQLQDFLKANQIPSMIYYPVPLYKQRAFENFTDVKYLPNTDRLCSEVISLPMHSELDQHTQDYIIEKVRTFFRGK